MSGADLWIFSSISIPFILGMHKSSRTISGRLRSTSSSPAQGSVAVRISSGCAFKAALTRSRLLGSSSIATSVATGCFAAVITTFAPA